MTDKPSQFALKGALTMSTVGMVYRSVAQFPAKTSVIIDLDAVEGVDSSAVALLLALAHLAVSRQCPIQFTAVPERLLTIADIYGTRDMLVPYC